MSETVIEIPEIKLRQMVVTIEGKTGLIVNRFGERSRQLIEDKQQKKARGAREARDPKAEFQDAMHVISEGVYGFPAAGIKKSLVLAGGRFGNEKMTHLRGLINVMGDLIPIKSKPPRMRSDPVVLKLGVTSIAYRPEFLPPWEMDVPVVFNAGLMSDSQVVNLFQMAGFAVGIGAWRPECNGVFGQFVVKRVSA